MTTRPAQPKLVVGVGASAGGLEAFKQLLSALPGDAGRTFLLVQHLDPYHKSLLAELLAPCTGMTVHDADQGIELEPDTVYIIRPDTALAVRNGRIALSVPTLHRGVRLPVDHLFRSLAREYGPRAVGIILSGAGSDGSGGIRDIKAAGGLTIAQAPESSAQPGMPQSAIDTGVVDLVLDIPEMPAALARFENLPHQARVTRDEDDVSEQAPPLSKLSGQEIGRLAALLDAQAGFDLRVYKAATIERRVLRRMGLSGFDDIALYFDHLRANPAEQQTLVRDLLISVTDFFRDPTAFQALREMVIDPLVAQAGPADTLRAWVPGCATGEEAYSIGMEFLDAADARNKRLAIQIFATDIDQDALNLARAGNYPTSIAEHVSERRLQRYFKPLDGKGYQVRAQLRDIVSFALHDLTKDPPFSRMQLVSCRNVLIYLTSEAQKHVLGILHFALEPTGHLFLSTSESTGPRRDLFATISKKQRIYRKVGSSRTLSVARSRNVALQGRQAGDAAREAASAAHQRTHNTGDLARRAVVEAFAPPTLVVSASGAVLFSHGRLEPFVRIPQGDNPRFELGAVLRPEIATRTRGAFYKCQRDKEHVVAVSSSDGAPERVRIEARPAPTVGDDAVILSFETLGAGGGTAPAQRAQSPEPDSLVDQLEGELHATREDLRNAVEELETSNEELRSSNEESMSMNEELQSANEELEATTEELRSLNEELTTVNTQLREKVEQVEQAHDDLGNFLSSTKIATVFLDERLRIKRFTPAAHDLLDIDHADTGRFIADIARELLQHNLADEAQSVLENMSVRSRNLRTRDGSWITRQVLPYRTENRRIEGVVVTFNDVTELRNANEELNKRARRLELAWEAARGGIFEHRIPIDASTYVSDQWAQVLGYRREELPRYDKLLSWLSEQAHPDDRERFARSYADLIEGRADRYVLELRFRHRKGQWIWVRKIAKVLDRDEQHRPCHLLRMMIDITDLKEVEAALKESETRFREMADGLPLMVWVLDEEGNQELVNQTFCDFFGVSHDEMNGGSWQIPVHPDDAATYARELQTCIADKRPFHAEARARRADGAWRWIESWGRPRRDSHGEFRGFVGTSADVTDRRRMEEVLRDSEERFRALLEASSEVLYRMSPDWSEMRQLHSRGFLANTEGSNRNWLQEYVPTDEQPRLMIAIHKAIRDKSTFELEHRVVRADGTIGWASSRAVPLTNPAGGIVEWFGAASDITDRKLADVRLREEHGRKDEFLAMLGHELRNPLAAIRTASEVLESKTDGNPGLVQTQQVLQRQTTHMAKLLDGLLDISRIIRGRIKLETQVLDFCLVCKEVATDIAGSLVGRRLEIRTDIPQEPLWVEADRIRLAQMVGNLLSNAVKYTPDGGSIMLSLGRNDGTAVLKVRDTGMGIEPDLLPHIFEIFRQSDQAMDRSQGGLGLGLALVRTLADLHGGSIRAMSDGAGKGAEFDLELPLSEERPRQTPEHEVGRGDALRILLIEDNEDAAEMLKEVLELSGHETRIAGSGKDGVAVAREMIPDVVICDLGLPNGMSGFDVARELRSDEGLRGLRLIALSGYGRPEDRKASAQAGFDAHLTKPADIEVVERVLADLAGPAGAPRETPDHE